VELFLRYGASETPTWIILPAAVALLFSTTSARAWAAGAALVGLWVALRLNDAPAALALLALFCLQRGERRRRVQIATAGVGVFLAAILIHNAVYGGELALVRAEPVVGGVTAHGTDSGVSALGAFVKAFSDPAVRAQMADRARAILYLPFAFPTDLETLVRRVAFHGLQLAWLAAVVWAVAARRSTSLTAKGMLLLPVVALGPYLALNVTAYYPRQIVLGYVAMGVSALYLLGSAGGATDRAAPSSRTGLRAPPPARAAVTGRMRGR
jgi:hypothetical protein